MTTVTTPRVDAPPPVQRQPNQPVGRLVFGSLLIVLGAVWLLDATGAFDLRWSTALAIALVVDGLALLGTARSGYHGGLVFLGFVLTGLLLVTTTVPRVNPAGGMGERVYAPASIASLQEEYELGAGPLQLDLRDLAITPGQQVPIRASVGAGELTVRLPEGAAVDVEAEVGAGEVTILDRTRNGLGVSIDERIAGTEGGGRFVLDLSVGFGSIEVTR